MLKFVGIVYKIVQIGALNYIYKILEFSIVCTYIGRLLRHIEQCQLCLLDISQKYP